MAFRADNCDNITVGPLEIFLAAAITDPPQVDDIVEPTYYYGPLTKATAPVASDITQAFIDTMTVRNVQTPRSTDVNVPGSADGEYQILLSNVDITAVAAFTKLTGAGSTVTIGGEEFSIWHRAGAANQAVQAVSWPGDTWAHLGAESVRSLSNDGETINHGQTLNPIYTVGSTGARQVVRDQETLNISFDLLDITAETYARVLNDIPITRVAAAAGVPGYRQFGVTRGIQVRKLSLLARGDGLSPYGVGNIQFYSPRVYVSGEPAPVFNKNAGSMLRCEFMALEDCNAIESERFGHWRMQDALRP